MQVITTFNQTPGIQAPQIVVPRLRIEDSRYVVRLAETEEEIDAALKLRFEVFNLELGEGLDSSYLNERDRDEFDSTCRHLVVLEKSSDRIVGTYRIRTLETALTTEGFYSAGEFDLRAIGEAVLAQSVELGRACIASDHRHRQVLHLLWRALAKFTLGEGKRFLFGCCSLTSQEPAEGRKLWEQLSQSGQLHPHFRVQPKIGFECDQLEFWQADVRIPRLFRTYLSVGAKVCGPPAIDRLFKTIDFFVVFDLFEISDRTRRLLFGK